MACRCLPQLAWGRLLGMFCSPRSVENRIGRDRFIQLFDRDLDGSADEEPGLIDAMADADRLIRATLRHKGYTDEQLDMLANDEMMRREAAWVVAYYGVLGKPELIGSEDSAYKKLAEAAMTRMETVANGLLRPVREQAAGKPLTVVGRIARPEPQFHMAPTADRPFGRGGF